MPHQGILRAKDSVDSEEVQVYESLESMRTFWQELDAPVEHLLTACVSFHIGAHTLDNIDIVLLQFRCCLPVGQ